MFELQTITTVLGVMVFATPVVLVIVLGVSSLFDRKLSESSAAVAVYITTVVSLIATFAIFAVMLTTDTRHVVVGPWNWVSISGNGEQEESYHFVIKFVFDRLSIPFVILSLVLCGTIGAFASKYMHREPGYNRFFTLYSLFLLGMLMAGAAGTIETLFTGWELVGLSSALLVGFFHERSAPVRNGFRVWVIYRISDAALLLAAIVLHHMSGAGDFDSLTGYRELPGVAPLDLPTWPFGTAEVTAWQAFWVGGLLLIAVAGKSALVPLSGWLPRAMEGPTPSSAVFYGALSVHLGAYLLLRVSPLLDASPVLSGLVVVLGLTTAAFAALVARVQTDIKSALSFASLTQVGLIVADIGLGWRYLPLVHLLGHACLRTLQFVRAPTFLQDRKNLENALGGSLHHPRNIESPFTRWLHRFAVERGYLDAILQDYFAKPFLAVFQWCDRMEHRITDAISGPTSAPSHSVPVIATELPEKVKQTV